MLHRKISQLCCNGREICVFLRDQQRWIERARIIELEGDLVTIKYETEEDDEMSSWEEIVRLVKSSHLFVESVWISLPLTIVQSLSIFSHKCLRNKNRS
jgi:hypothetical protein